MNLKSYDKCTRMLKRAELASSGYNLENENVLMIGIVDCVQNGSAPIIANIAHGVRQANGVSMTFNVENYHYLQRLSPATAKYARNYIDFTAKSVEAIARTNILDCVVAVVDNYVTGLGVLEGCTRINCPVILMPVGVNPNYDTSILMTAGKVATREIKSTAVDQITNAYAKQFGIAPQDTLTLNFIKMAQAFGLTLNGATDLVYNQGATLHFAYNTGVEAMKRADDIITTKRLISKRTLNDGIEQYQNNGGNISGLLPWQNLFTLVDVKMPTGLYNSLKGSLVDQAYVVSKDTAPLTMQGQAWVYQSMTDALSALTSNAIDNGIIVLQYCVNCDVTLVAQTVMAMNKANEIAILTDGYCADTQVLTIANITPTAFENQDFANIQNGDILEIDVTKGRLNTETSSKDMKVRAKRNIAKKHEIYF